jgi:alkylation response protein AidB-like acyl-CoA dehydrogenase
MDFDLGSGVDDFRAEVRAFMNANVTDAVRARCYASGTGHDWEFYAALAERRWIAISWPKEYGGQGRDPLESAIFFEESNYARAPIVGLNTTMVAARAVLHYGSDELRNNVLPRVFDGEIIMSLGFSEPESGSDVAGARTRAERDGDEWIVNGQKVFTTTAEEAEYILLLTRTDPSVPKHEGLTVFLVPRQTEGISITPIYTLAERTNMTYYADVRVDDRWRVGDVNRGWEVMTTALMHERGGHGYAGQMVRLMDDILKSLAEFEDDGLPGRAESDSAVAEAIGRFAAEVEVAQLLDYQTAWIVAQGGKPSIEGSMAKLFASESQTAACARFLDIIGPRGLVTFGNSDAPAGGWVELAHRLVTPATVYGGASEVQRSIIAERALGLPRSR